jgi:hypothetical protein
MDKQLLEVLLEYIDARIDEKLASDYYDGGLVESIKTNKLKEELFAYVDSQGLPT